MACKTGGRVQRLLASIWRYEIVVVKAKKSEQTRSRNCLHVTQCVSGETCARLPISQTEFRPHRETSRLSYLSVRPAIKLARRHARSSRPSPSANAVVFYVLRKIVRVMRRANGRTRLRGLRKICPLERRIFLHTPPVAAGCLRSEKSSEKLLAAYVVGYSCS